MPAPELPEPVMLPLELPLPEEPVLEPVPGLDELPGRLRSMELPVPAPVSPPVRELMSLPAPAPVRCCCCELS